MSDPCFCHRDGTCRCNERAEHVVHDGYIVTQCSDCGTVQEHCTCGCTCHVNHVCPECGCGPVPLVRLEGQTVARCAECAQSAEDYARAHCPEAFERPLCACGRGDAVPIDREVCGLCASEAREAYEQALWPVPFREEDCGGAFDGFSVSSDADGGL